MATSETRKMNWFLVLGGLILLICGIAIFVAPGFFLEFLTIWAGVGFLLSGFSGIGSYFAMRKFYRGASWNLFMAILDLLVGIALIVHPLAFAEVVPWILGAVFIAFGVIQVAGIMPFAQIIPESRAIAIVSGLLSAIVGIMFIVWPESLSLWIAAFALVRGITLVSMGFTSRG